MAYTKQTWADGDIISAEKLNHIEDGIDGASGGAVISQMVFLKPKDIVNFTAGQEIKFDSSNSHFLDAEDNEVDIFTGVFVPYYYMEEANGISVSNTYSNGIYGNVFYFTFKNNGASADLVESTNVLMAGSLYTFE